MHGGRASIRNWVVGWATRREKHEFRRPGSNEIVEKEEEIRGGRRGSLDADSSRFMGAVFEQSSLERREGVPILGLKLGQNLLVATRRRRIS